MKIAKEISCEWCYTDEEFERDSLEALIAEKLEPVKEALRGLLNFIECEPKSEHDAQNKARAAIAMLEDE